MNKQRLETFSDGVIAILMTILVFNLRAPSGSEWNSLVAVVPNLLSWTLSFAFLGIYWNNHHHLLHAAGRINGQVLWANQHLLFWLCLVPFVTNWLGQSDFATIPTALYGFVFLLAGVAYFALQRALIVADGPNSKLSSAIGRDWKGKASLILYALAIPGAFIYTRFADVLYVVVALMWFVPDRRIENYRNHP